MAPKFFELKQTQEFTGEQTSFLPEHTSLYHLKLQPLHEPAGSIRLSLQVISTHQAKNGLADIVLSKDEQVQLIGAINESIQRPAPITE